MVTCTICNRTTQSGLKGTSWICEDCKVGGQLKNESKEDEKPEVT